MKKLAILGAGALLCAALLAGCGSQETPAPAVSSQPEASVSSAASQPAASSAAPSSAPASSAAAANTQSGNYIGETRAEEIARKAVNVTGGTVTQNRLELDDGVWAYQVDLVDGNTKYEFEIDATTGAIREQSQEQVSGGQAASGISADQAEQIARDAAKVTGGTVVKNQLDNDDGRQVYDVEIVKDGMEYSVEIDAATGSVLEQSAETQD